MRYFNLFYLLIFFSSDSTITPIIETVLNILFLNVEFTGKISKKSVNYLKRKKIGGSIWHGSPHR